MAGRGGIALVIVGAWAIAQVTYGDALERLNFTSRLTGDAAAPTPAAAPAAGATVGSRLEVGTSTPPSRPTRAQGYSAGVYGTVPQ